MYGALRKVTGLRSSIDKKPEKNNIEPRLINIDELSIMLNISKSTIYNRLAEDKKTGNYQFPRSVRIGSRSLWHKKEVEEYVNYLLVSRDKH